jgi:pantetheine-phosphate adenylyltransferase
MPVHEGDAVSTALCPGSFDPPTNGHLDVIVRAASMFDRLLVVVIHNPTKTPLFSAEERVELLRQMLPAEIEVEKFSGLLVDYAKSREVNVIVKGLRVVSDFDYELQMAQMNRTLSGVETVFLPTNPTWGYLSSSLVREVAKLGGSVDTMVPDNVLAALKEKLE